MPTITVNELKALVKAGQPIRKPIGNGLYFKINNSGNASWFFRYALRNARREFTLGEYPELPLSEANRLAAEAKKQVKAGLDPIEEKKRANRAQEFTCDRLFDDWFAKDLERRLKYPNIPFRIYRKEVSPVFGKLSVDQVTPFEVQAVLENIRDSGRLAITNDALMYMKQLFQYAIKLNLIQYNPAANFTTNDAGGVEIAKDRALSKEEISQAFEVFRNNISSFGMDNYIACSLFLMLAVRKSELCEAKWAEFDMDKAVWNLPSGRSKTGAAISIPFSTQAAALFRILKIRAGYSDYVFPARRASKTPHMGSDTLNRAITKCFGHEAGRKVQPANLMGDIPHFTIHDFRRTFRTLCSKLGISGDVAERCLNHKIKGVEGIYDRHDYFEERKNAHQRVSDHLEPLLKLKLFVHGVEAYY